MLNEKDIFEILVCEEHTSIMDVSLMLRQTLSQQLVIINSDEELVGIVSLQDIIFRGVCEELDLEKTQISEIMTKNVESIELNKCNKEICQRFIEVRNHHIPVTKNNKLVGVVDKLTLMKALYNNCEE